MSSLDKTLVITKNFSFRIAAKLMHWQNLLIGKGIITDQELLQRISKDRATYRRMLSPTRQ